MFNSKKINVTLIPSLRQVGSDLTIQLTLDHSVLWFFNTLFSSLAYFMVAIQCTTHTTYRICVIQLLVLSVRLPVNTRLLVVQFWDSQKSCMYFQLQEGSALLTYDSLSAQLHYYYFLKHFLHSFIYFSSSLLLSFLTLPPFPFN